MAEGQEDKVDVPADFKIIDAPTFYASQIQVMFTGNDATIVFARTRSTTSGNVPVTNIVRSEPVAIIVMSPQTAKDLLVLLKGQTDIFEKEFGEITTPYTKKQAGG
jgi:hypothetical protein